MPHPSSPTSPTSATSPTAKHFITGSPARQRGWRWPCWRKPRRASQTSALEASGPWTDHAGLAHWGVYGNVGPEAGPAAGLASLEAPPGLRVPAWQGTSKAAAEALFASTAHLGSRKLRSPGVSKWWRRARSSDQAPPGHSWKVASTRERHGVSHGDSNPGCAPHWL